MQTIFETLQSFCFSTASLLVKGWEKMTGNTGVLVHQSIFITAGEKFRYFFVCSHFHSQLVCFANYDCQTAGVENVRA